MSFWSPTLDTFNPAEEAWKNALKEAGLDENTPMPKEGFNERTEDIKNFPSEQSMTEDESKKFTKGLVLTTMTGGVNICQK